VESRFEPRSYGFRPGRGCDDAIEAVFHVACTCALPRPTRIFEAFAAALRRIHALPYFG